MATLARYESDATDDAGNLLANVTVEVRLESGGLASIYSDRAGTVPLANPFNDADGHIGFHVAGGAYKITFTQGVISRIRRYVAIGLSAETDFPVPTFVPTPGDFCDVAVFEQGLCQNGELLHRQEFTSTVVFPAGLPLSRFSAGVPATAPVAFTFAKNGTAFGTANFAAGVAEATFAAAADTVFLAGDILTVTSPSPADATLANVAGTLRGTRDTTLPQNGVATLDFGAFPGTDIAVLAITGLTLILSTSIVNVWVWPGSGTAEHSVDEHKVAPFRITASDLVAGTGFTINAFATDGFLSGRFNVAWRWL
jgi:hypothetical protein